MTLEQLTPIIQQADEKAITEELKKLGYINCKKDKRCRDMSLVTLFKGKLLETDDFTDKKGKRTYQGGIITQVSGYEQTEFIIVNINDNKKVFPIDLLIWGKEI